MDSERTTALNGFQCLHIGALSLAGKISQTDEFADTGKNIVVLWDHPFNRIHGVTAGGL